MLKVIHIITLAQGIFLLFVLLKSRKKFRKVNFWLLVASVFSIILYSFGDDDHNLFRIHTDWFFFHETLLITLFVLFVKYFEAATEVFKKRDWLFFIPYGLNCLLHFTKPYIEGTALTVVKGLHDVVELSFVAMLFYTIFFIIEKHKEKWLLFFVIPLTVIFIIDELSYFITGTNECPFDLDKFGNILVSMCLFYFVLYKLITAPKSILPNPDKKAYKSSSLDTESALRLKVAIEYLIEEEHWFKNQKLTVQMVAKELGVQRQQVSEVLNMYMKIGFQDYLNTCRVNEFMKVLNEERYQNYTLLAIAFEVGFSSKSSFNTTFKKMKGMTPSQYRKSVL